MNGDRELVGFLLAFLIWLALPLLAIGGLEWWHRQADAPRKRPVVAMVAVGVVWALVTMFLLFGLGF